jgi:Mg2+/Co2+ transporter CorC
MELLEQFRASGANMTLVIDEYGELQGLVTLQDVFEAVIGEFRPRRAEDAWAVQRDDGSWLLDGLIPIPELTDRLGLSEEPDEERAGYQTLSGLVMWVLGRVPQTGDVVTWQQWRPEVVDMDGKRRQDPGAHHPPRGGAANLTETRTDPSRDVMRQSARACSPRERAHLGRRRGRPYRSTSGQTPARRW